MKQIDTEPTGSLEEGVIFCSGILPCHLNHCQEDALSWLNSFKEEMFSLQSLFQRYEAGGERDEMMLTQLPRTLENALSYLLLMRAYLGRNQTYSVINPRHHHRIDVELSGDRWVAHGFLGLHRKVHLEKFDTWSSRFLERELEDLKERARATERLIQHEKNLIVSSK